MTIKNFITKGILPLLLIGVITWLGRYIFMVDGSIDWFRFMLGIWCSDWNTIYVHNHSGKMGFIRNDWNGSFMCCDRSCIWFYCYDWNWDTGSLVCDCISSK